MTYDLENIIGMFVNMLPIVTFPQNNKTFIEFMQEIFQTLLNGLDNQEYPFDELVDKLEKDKNGLKLFNVAFDFIKYDEFVEEESKRKKINENIINEVISSKFDFEFFVKISNKISITIGYKQYLFEKMDVNIISGFYHEIIDAIFNNKEIYLKEIILSHNLTVANTSILEEIPDSFDFDF